MGAHYLDKTSVRPQTEKNTIPRERVPYRSHHFFHIHDLKQLLHQQLTR